MHRDSVLCRIVFTVGLFMGILSACDDGHHAGEIPVGKQPPSGRSTAEISVSGSPVSGLEYESGEYVSMTDKKGQFHYNEGQVIVFKIGDIVLGRVVPSGNITTFDLVSSSADDHDPQVTNIIRFLATLDDDGDVNNGIQISTAVRFVAIGLSLDFNQPVGQFESDSQVIAALAQLTAVTSKGTSMLIDITSDLMSCSNQWRGIMALNVAIAGHS